MSAPAILIADLWLPTPDRDAGSLRMFELLRILTARGWDVTLAAHRPQYSAGDAGELHGLGIEVLPASVSVTRHLRERGARYAAIFLSRVEVAVDLLAPARAHAPRARVIFDTLDLSHVRHFRQARHLGNAPMLAHSLRRKAEELAIVRDADCTLVVSKTEQRVLEAACPGSDIRVVSLIHDAPGAAARPFSGRSGAVFVGNFGHHPNVDALDRLTEEVWPLIAAAPGGPTLHVVGSDVPARIAGRETDGIFVEGHLPSLADVYVPRRMSVAPLRFGAGVKGKVVASLAHGVPVVGSACAFEGIPVRPGRDVLLAETAEQTAAAVVRLNADERLWRSLSARGPEIVAEHFSRAVAERGLLDALAGARPEPAVANA